MRRFPCGLLISWDVFWKLSRGILHPLALTLFPTGERGHAVRRANTTRRADTTVGKNLRTVRYLLAVTAFELSLRPM